MKQTKFIKNNGFTIIEALLAVFILMIAIISIIQLYPAGLKMSRLTKNEIKATNLLQAELENIQAIVYNNVSSQARIRFSDDQQSSYYNFEKEIVVVFIDQNLNNSITDTNMKKITVTIYWQEQSQEKSMTNDIIIRK